jgi:Na+-transporting NADH:ubiquinone oxidoreductase subunit A
MLVNALFVIAGILIISAIISITDNLLQFEAKKSGVDTQKENFSLFPRFRELFGAQAPAFTDGSPFYKLKKGHDIKLVGAASGDVIQKNVTRYSVKPTNYRGIAPIPKLLVQQGDEVKAGQAIFFDKGNEKIKYVTPVSGEILEVRRGEKRAISDIIILADKTQVFVQNDVPNLSSASRKEIIEFMMSSGLWPLINRRPFDTIANPEETPRDIFISTFDTAPLAMDNRIIIDGDEEAFQKGIDLLNKLTDGVVYLGMNGKAGHTTAAGFQNAKHVEKHYFDGAHPAGNVGVQIHHIKPIKSGDNVWTLKVLDVITIGKMFLTGKYSGETYVALTGSEFITPSYIKTMRGANIQELVEGNLKESKVRMISGDVLTGKTIPLDGFLNSQDNQLTTLKEGDHNELFGWLLPIKPRPSISKTFPNFLMPSHEFETDTNTHGEKRAFVMSGQYESVLPMDIYPQSLMKAIMAGDFERMEGLGINELSEEDIAICEFACTSKMPLQEILRDGLDMIQEQS